MCSSTLEPHTEAMGIWQEAKGDHMSPQETGEEATLREVTPGFQERQTPCRRKAMAENNRPWENKTGYLLSMRTTYHRNCFWNKGVVRPGFLPIHQASADYSAFAFWVGSYD